MKKHLVTVKPLLDFPFLRRMLIQAIPIGAFYLTNYVYNYLDTIMIGAFRQAEEIGWYSAAYRLYEGFLIIPAVISSVLMPRIARAYKEDKHELGKLAQIGTGLAFSGGLICAFGITLGMASLLRSSHNSCKRY
jgi:O-antigen/teichoic acid export membrane protein